MIEEVRLSDKSGEMVVVSNLNNFSKKSVELMIKKSPSMIVGSIDGANKDTYEKIRVNGDWNKMVKNLEKIELMKKKCEITLPKNQEKPCNAKGQY